MFICLEASTPNFVVRIIIVPGLMKLVFVLVNTHTHIYTHKSHLTCCSVKAFLLLWSVIKNLHLIVETSGTKFYHITVGLNF